LDYEVSKNEGLMLKIVVNDVKEVHKAATPYMIVEAVKVLLST